MRLTHIGLFAVSLALLAAPARSALLNVDTGGNLLGAQDVNVAGVGLFDVAFAEDSCANLFPDCNDASDFHLANQTEVGAAAQALLDQVFINDGPLRLFDDDPTLTFGCGASSFGLGCNVMIPFGNLLPNGRIPIGSAVNRNQLQTDTIINSGSIGPSFNSAASETHVFAIFTAASSSPTSSVPEPAGLLLVGAGLAALTALRRRTAGPARG